MPRMPGRGAGSIEVRPVVDFSAVPRPDGADAVTAG